MSEERKYWSAFHRIPEIGQVKLGELPERFGSLQDTWQAPDGQMKAAGLDSRSVSAITQARPDSSPEAEVERLRKAQVSAVMIDDASYPSRLKESFDPPPVLYVQGTLRADESAVTIGRARAPTSYGREVARSLPLDLAHNGVSVVSGLARRIDSVAHQAAMEGGDRTIVVQACGLDMVYPSAHASLARQILEQGALVSDYPLGTKPRAEHFPRRNRTLAGLTAGTLVVTAEDKSGALTSRPVRCREVMCVPGSIHSPVSRGTNRWIREGAKAILEVEDILEELNFRTMARQMELPEPVSMDNTEAQVLKHVTVEPTHIDEIVRASGLPVAIVSSTLAVLALRGLVSQSTSMSYVQTRREAVDYVTSTP